VGRYILFASLILLLAMLALRAILKADRSEKRSSPCRKPRKVARNSFKLPLDRTRKLLSHSQMKLHGGAPGSPFWYLGLGLLLILFPFFSLWTLHH